MSKTQFAICRTEKIKSWATLAKSVGHNMRTSLDERQHLADVAEPLRVLAGDPAFIEPWKLEVEGMHLRKLQQGASHTLAREFFLGMSPEWAHGKTPKQINAWAAENITWLEDRFGKERIKLAVLHLDEQTPHIAAYIVPLKKDPKNRGTGWTLSDASLGLSGSKNALVELQTEYAAAMEKFDLKRGLSGSKAKHKTTAQWRAEMAQPLDQAITYPNIPDPTIGDRFDPKPYAEAAAKAAAGAVFKQMKGHRAQARKQTTELEQQRKEMTKLRAMIEQLEPLANMLKTLLEAVLGHPLALNTIQGQEQAIQAAQSLVGAVKPKAKTTAVPAPLAPPPVQSAPVPVRRTGRTPG